MITAEVQAIVPKGVVAEVEAVVPKALPVKNKDVVINENGSYEVVADDNTTMGKVSVEVDVPETEVRNKSITIDENGRYTIEADDDTLMSKVSVEVDVKNPIDNEPDERDVNFYDYDGTLLYSYHWNDVEKLTELPIPSNRHEGLIFDGWNYTLEDILEQGDCADIGALYTTINGMMRLKIMTTYIQLKLSIFSYNPITVYWDDGVVETFAENINHSITHEYGNVLGIKKTIFLDVKGYYRFSISDCIVKEINITDGQSSTINCSTKKVSFSKNFIGVASFNHSSFDFISIPQKNNSNEVLRENITQYASFAKKTTISSTVAYNNTYLNKLIIPSEANILDYNSGNFANYIKKAWLYKIRVSKNNQLFDSRNNCNAIIETSTNALILGCNNTKIPNGVVTINSYAFGGAKLATIDFPNTLVCIKSNAFINCSSLKDIYIPDSVTSVETNAFYNTGAERISIGKGLTEIVQNSFIYSYNAKIIDCTRSMQVPTLANINAFSGISTTCKIVVPDALYDQWVVATNWTTYASRIVKASEFVEPTEN